MEGFGKGNGGFRSSSFHPYSSFHSPLSTNANDH